MLGESKASELRGESMQDVIFNGTTSRKPASRASVELIFRQRRTTAPAASGTSSPRSLAWQRAHATAMSSYYIYQSSPERPARRAGFLARAWARAPGHYRLWAMTGRIIESSPRELLRRKPRASPVQGASARDREPFG